MLFADFALKDSLLEAAAAAGWERPTPIQELVIPAALDGRDILGRAPTGTGKSGAFLLPLLHRLPAGGGVWALILEPSRELAEQIAGICNQLSAAPLCRAIIGGGDRQEQRQSAGRIIAATPGRLREFIQKGWLDLSGVGYYVIDEADRMLDMGFIDEVRSITRALGPKPQTLLFSATLEGAGIREFARGVLSDPVEILLSGAEKLPEGLTGRAYYAASDANKLKILRQLLTTVRGKSLVFVKTRERLARLNGALHRLGIKCATLQGEMTLSERQAALRRFKEDRTELLLATDVAARGLDIEDITHVYNYDLPGSAAAYVHRAGRTARAGRRGTVISLVLADELETLRGIERYTGQEIERRALKNICAVFPENPRARHRSEKKRSRAARGGGFDRKPRDGEKKRKPKIRYRDRRNKGKPDFAAKRARRAQDARAPES